MSVICGVLVLQQYIDMSSPFHFTAEDVSYFILQQKLIVFLQ